MDVSSCRHQFADEGTAPFVGTTGARMCAVCKHIEVRIGRRWLSFDDYLARRRAERADVDVAGSSSGS